MKSPTSTEPVSVTIYVCSPCNLFDVSDVQVSHPKLKVLSPNRWIRTFVLGAFRPVVLVDRMSPAVLRTTLDTLTQARRHFIPPLASRRDDYFVQATYFDSFFSTLCKAL